MIIMSKSLDKKINAGREYRAFQQQFEVRATDDSEKIVEGYATTFNQPYLLYKYGDYSVSEQIDKDAFNECDMSDVIFQYDHAGRVYARTSNGTLKLEIDSKGLKIVANLGGTESGRQLYEEIKGGYTNKMSFGFIVAEQKRESEEKEDGSCAVLRTITKISKLYDVSAVSIPANDATEISARNFSDGVIAEIKAERLKSHNENETRERKRKQLQLKIKTMGV